MEYLTNLLIFLAKLLIHKSKFLKRKANVITFLVEFNYYVNSRRFSE